MAYPQGEYNGVNAVEKMERLSGATLERSNPDVGPTKSNSGHMPMSKNEYGLSGEYRGNEYNKLIDKVNSSDSKKLARTRKDMGYRS